MELAYANRESPEWMNCDGILVTGCSFWSDVYTFVGRRPEQRVSLFTADWTFKFDSGLQINQPHLEELHEDSRRLIISLHRSPPQGRKALGGQSLARAFECMRTALRWMVSENICSWSQITPAISIRYLDYLKTCRKKASGEIKEPSAITLSRYLDVFKIAYLQRELLRGQMRVDPLQGETSCKFCGVQWTRCGSIPAVPMKEAKALVSNCQQILDVAMQKAQPDFESVKIAVGAYVMSRFGERVIIYHDKYNRLPLDYSEDILRTACLVLIVFFSGLRMSELRHLRVDCSAIETIGGVNVTVITGHILKQKDQPEPHVWIAPDFIQKCIACLNLLSARDQKDSEDNYLLSLSPIRRRPTKYDQGDYIEVLSEWRASRDLRKLWNLLDLPDLEREPSFHQGRKTFAKVLASVLHDDLLPVSYQLGHLSKLITDQGYFKKYFSDLEDEIKEAVFIQAVEKLSTASERPLGGIVGNYLEAKLQNESPTTVAQKRMTLLGDLISSAATFAGNRWGYCVYNQRSSNCGGSAIAPNPAGRTPSVCAECANLLVTGSHAAFWKDLMERNLEIQNVKGASPQAVAIASQRIAEARKFLGQIDEPF